MSLEYGYNLAASGMLTAMFRQDVASNNLANLETTGFKPDRAFTIPRDAARIEDKLFNLPSNKLLERLGAGVLLAPTRTSFQQGSLNHTGNPLDVAIQGDGFLTVSVPGATQGVRLTRDGRMTLDRDGNLITLAGGHAVLDENSHPITIDPTGEVHIDSDGAIYQNGSAVARLRLVDLPNRQQLHKVGEGMYTASPAALASLKPAGGDIVQGHIEHSAVDPIQAMMSVQDAANAVTMNGRMLSIHDELAGRLINTLGRVA
jgi:flagellar basal-body rod protein FlgG